MLFAFKKNAVQKLADNFPTDNFPIDKAVLKNTVQVGRIRYRRCASFCLDKEGIYLRIRFIFKSYPDIFIPWSFIKEARKSKLYSMKAVEFILSNSSLPSQKIYEKYCDSSFTNYNH